MENLLNRLKLDKKKILLVLLAFLALVYLDYTLLLKPQLRNLKSIGPRIQKLKGELTNLSSQIARMQESRSRHLQAKEEALSKAKKVISEGQIPSLLEEIADVARKNEVEVTQMKPSRQKASVQKQREGSSEIKFEPLLIQLDLLCAYHQLGRFINELENKKIFIAVEELQVTSQPQDYFKHKAELTLKSYVEEK